MCICALSVGVNNVHYIVAIPNVLVSHLGLPWGMCPYPRTYSWRDFNKLCRCEAIECLQDCSQWQFHVPHRVQMSSANISGALSLCQWQQEGFRRNVHGLQVDEIAAPREASSTVHVILTSFTCTFYPDHWHGRCIINSLII